MDENTAIAGLRRAIKAVERIKQNDYPSSDRTPYNRGGREALDEVVRVCRMEIKFLKESGGKEVA